MSEGPERDEVHEAVDRAVEELLAAAGVAAPPVDAVALAQRHLGLAIRLDGREPRRGARSVAPRPEPTEEQRQWAAAHAVGEHLKADLRRRLGVDPAQALGGVSLANLFAHRLLVPTRWLAEQARSSGYDLQALKEYFRTPTHEAIAWRLLDLPEPCVITVVDNGAVARRRSNAWRVPRALAPAERECQRYVHHHGRPRAVRAGGWSVQGWPVPQADAKREVLRSVVEESYGEPGG